MSTPLSHELPKDVFAELIDGTYDAINRQTGKHTVQNTTNNSCGGEKPIRECATASVLTKQLIEKAVEFEPDSLEIAQSKLFAAGIQVTAEITCEECSLMCHAATRVLDGKTNERIRFMFEDTEAPSHYKDTGKLNGSSQLVVLTSFEGEYDKLNPGLLACE